MTEPPRKLGVGVEPTALAAAQTDEELAIDAGPVRDRRLGSVESGGEVFHQSDQVLGVLVVHGAHAIQLSHAIASALRQNHRMAYEALLALIDKRRAELDISERALCLAAKVGLNTIRHVRSRGHAPKPQALVALAGALKIPPDELLLAAVDESISIEPKKKRPDTVTVYLKGRIGIRRWALNELSDPSEWVRYLLPANVFGWSNQEMSAYLLEDDSADLLYRRYSVILVRPFRGAASVDARTLRTEKLVDKQRVVVRFRETAEGRVNLRVFEIEIRDNDTLIFWPRSTNPKYQEPIVYERERSGAFVIFDQPINLTEKVTMEPAYLVLGSIVSEEHRF